MIYIDGLDVQPDRFDERDLTFRPRLRDAPAIHHNNYADEVPVLKQKTGQCTGYAAAGLVNLLLHSQQRHVEQRNREKSGDLEGRKKPEEHRNLEPPATLVSPEMLYELARMYDEWEGENYSGSSCRGVLKGWHHHGVCKKSKWKTGWRSDAAKHPIGAYYRVDRSSITDLRLAILEAGAVLVSAQIHSGWLGRLGDKKKLPIHFQPAAITRRGEVRGWPTQSTLGLHAFLLVGYEPRGLIVQNSWNEGWGYRGFAILTYRDWLANGIDAWVVSLGAPADPESFESPAFRSGSGLLEIEDSSESDKPLATGGRTWTETEAREHTVVFAKNGEPAKRRVAWDDGKSEMTYHLQALAKAATATNLLIYFMGGLENEDDALTRIRRIGPFLEAGQVIPFFVIWRTEFLAEIASIVATQIGDEVRSEELAARPEARDRLFELMARRFLRPLWTEVKQDARNGFREKGGLRELSELLRGVLDEHPDIRLHLAAHSAGALPLRHFLRLAGPIKRQGKTKDTPAVPVTSCTLLAPLCKVEFARQVFARALEKGVLAKGTLACEGLQDKVELTDGVGDIYRPSLPILVSRVLERDCETPLLCLEKVWDPPPEGVRWGRNRYQEHVRQWRVFRATQAVRSRFLAKDGGGHDGRRPASPGHLDFDMDRNVLSRLVEHCRSARTNPASPPGVPIEAPADNDGQPLSEAGSSSTMSPPGGTS